MKSRKGSVQLRHSLPLGITVVCKFGLLRMLGQQAHDLWLDLGWTGASVIV